MTNALTLSPTIIARSVRNDPALKSEHSQRQYIANLGQFEAYRNGRDMTKTLVQSYLADLQRQDLAPSTINQKLATIKWWARRVADLAYDYLPPEQARVIAEQATRITEIKGDSGTRPKRGRHIDPEEIRRLLEACDDDTLAGLRDRALFAVLWTTGMRQAEVRALRVNHITKEQNSATVEVYGKGDKYRKAYITNGALATLERWLDVRPNEGYVNGFVFCPIRKNDHVATDYSLSHESIRKIFEKRQRLAGLDKHLTPHDFRRTFAGTLLDSYDMATVQDLLGHASPTTTKMYDRRPEQRKRQAVESIKLPE